MMRPIPGHPCPGQLTRQTGGRTTPLPGSLGASGSPPLTAFDFSFRSGLARDACSKTEPRSSLSQVSSALFRKNLSAFAEIQQGGILEEHPIFRLANALQRYYRPLADNRILFVEFRPVTLHHSPFITRPSADGRIVEKSNSRMDNHRTSSSAPLRSVPFRAVLHPS